MTTEYQAEEVLAYDGESIKIIWYPDATTQSRGLVKPDGTTITISNGIISAAGGSGVPAQSVSNAKVYASGNTYKLSWTDPADVSVQSYDFYKWDKTVIVAKDGSYPDGPTDGTVVVQETTRNTYQNAFYSWTPQTSGNYYFKAFCYGTDGKYGKTDDDKFTGLAPNPVSNAYCQKINTGYQLKWNDPADGSLLSWACTFIVRKENSYPANLEDGDLVLTSTTRNAYSSTPYTDVLQDPSKTYYYRAFTYSTNDLYNSDNQGKFEGVTPGAATDCYVDKTSHAKPELIWSDPADVTFCTWAKTVIVRKVGSAPTSPTDGTVIYTETTKNSHTDKNSAYTDSTAVSGTNYYYKAFPCSTNEIYNTSSAAFEEKTLYQEVYEFIINTAESDPTAAVTYAGANASYTPASMNFSTGAINYGSWASAFFQPRPVMVKNNGTVDYELSKNDFTKKADGVTASDVSNTSYGGNCMIAFPQIWFKFVQDDSTHQHVYIASEQIDNSYHCYTHQNKNGTMLDEIFIMAFEPSNVSNKLRSLADQTGLDNLSGETMRQYAQANGNAWDFMDFGEIQMLQMLLVLMFKSLDSQSKIGAGVCGGTKQTTTGTLKNKPMFYATNNTSSSNASFKAFGIENLWGNRYKWFNGLVITSTSNGSKIKYKLCDYTTDGSTATAYTSTGTGYKVLTSAPSANKSGYATKMQLSADGLIPYPDYIGSGSETTYLCDYQYLGKATTYDRFARFGGSYGNGANDGLFCVYVYNQLSYAAESFGASLSCKPL